MSSHASTVGVDCPHCDAGIHFERFQAQKSLIVCPNCLLSFCYCVKCGSFMKEVVAKELYYCTTCKINVSIKVKVCAQPTCYVKVDDLMADMRTCQCGRIFCSSHWKDTVVCAGCPITEGYQALCKMCAVAKNDYFLCPNCIKSQ